MNYFPKTSFHVFIFLIIIGFTAFLRYNLCPEFSTTLFFYFTLSLFFFKTLLFKIFSSFPHIFFFINTIAWTVIFWIFSAVTKSPYSLTLNGTFIFIFAGNIELFFLKYFGNKSKHSKNSIFFWEPMFISQLIFIAAFIFIFAFISIPSIYIPWISSSIILVDIIFTITYFFIFKFYILSLISNKNEIPSVLYKKLQIFPYFLSLIQIIFVTFLLLINYFICEQILSIPGYYIGLFEFIIFLLFMLGQLYTLLWIKQGCSYLIKKIRDSFLPKEQGFIRSPIGLHLKMGIWFGSLVFLSIIFVGFFGYIQYKTILSNFLNKKAASHIQQIESTLNNSYYIAQTEVSSTLNSILKQKSLNDDAYYYYLPNKGTIFAIHNSEKNPILPILTRSKIRTQKKGSLDLYSLNLYGFFTNIKYKDQNIGTVVILYSGTKLFPFDKKERFLGILLFFMFTGLLILGGVGYFVSEFTKPLKRMEANLSVIVAGNFNKSIKFEGEEDEIGRLSLALENLRQTIREKILTIEEMNKNLENKIGDRTKDLAKANKELKYALDVLKETQDQLITNQKLASLGKLLAGLAHEINNPLNTISNTLNPLKLTIQEIISKEEQTDEDIEDMEIMISVLERGTQRIKGVLERITGSLNPMDEPPVKTDLKLAMENSLLLLKKELTDIQIIKKYNPSPIYIMAHQIPMEQVFSNIIINAIHAMEKQSKKILNIELKKDNKFIFIIITDTGEGISESIKNKIFDPFFSTKKVGKGMGLGLSLVYDIIRRYNGNIEYSVGNNEKGTKVTIKFTLAE